MMLLFTVFYSLAKLVLFMIVVFQFLLTLFTNQPNARLKQLGLEIASYLYQIACYLSFNSEDPVYPFAEWPKPRQPANVSNSKEPCDVDDMVKKIEQDEDIDGD